MNETKSKWRWVRAVGATLLALLVFAIVLPSMAKIVMDNSTTPPTRHVEFPPSRVLLLVGVVGVPLALILIGTFVRPSLARIGWALLITLTALVFMG